MTPRSSVVRDMLDDERAPEVIETIGLFPKPELRETARVKMDRGSAKLSIFDTMKGPHDMRFVPFKDISEQNSKY